MKIITQNDHQSLEVLSSIEAFFCVFAYLKLRRFQTL
ncbi:hypothetical protein BF29_3248 [Heyndrickxia coagulans DSM 1 = ATCC 7050]|nr:hypothetical protein BF29_3248 [Heyndrickxia coagulans DSM 1 = ATCC 7050]